MAIPDVSWEAVGTIKAYLSWHMHSANTLKLYYSDNIVVGTVNKEDVVWFLWPDGLDSASAHPLRDSTLSLFRAILALYTFVSFSKPI